jgi:four helix bundle protein
VDKPHKRLDAWKLAMELVGRVYTLTKRFPSEERYGLTDQMRRAAVSVPCNIAEGAARQTRKEFVNFLHIAQGSLSELDTLSDVAVRLSYVNIQEREDLDVLMERLDKTLSGLIRQQRKLVSSQ